MNIEDNDLNQIEPTVNDPAVTAAAEEQVKNAPSDSLQDDIIRNDTIPEAPKDTPGSNGAFPVGAFDTSKDL